MATVSEEETSILDKLDSVVPAPLAQFDAFPKLPSTYKSRSESRGFMTIFVAFLAFLLMLNDIGEFIWGWPDYEFSVDADQSSFMNINVDMVVNMPCRYLSVDLRDAIGDRLFLSGSGLRRDGTRFDIGQATKLKQHSEALSASQAVSQSRKSRGFFDAIFRRSTPSLKPTYDYQPHGSACRVWGTLEVKKVTANLHITTLGHGYASHEHVDHKMMNLSHVITEFSFGPFFPEIIQPLDLSFETTQDPFVAYQYFLHVVPTAYIAPRTAPLHTHQYSVTHYTRVLEHNRGTPGIFFKFDLDPMSLTIHQRTTSFIQLVIRCVGVIGGVFVCMGYAIRITTRAVEVVSGNEDQGIVAATSSGAKVGLRAKWAGTELRSRGKMIRQGSGWTLESNPGSPAIGSGYSSYSNSPMAPSFSGSAAPSPYLPSASLFPPSNPVTPNPGATFGPGTPSSSRFVPPPPRTPRSTSGGSMNGVLSPALSNIPSAPGTPAIPIFPPTPNPATNGNGFPTSPPPPRRVVSGGPKKDD